MSAFLLTFRAARAVLLLLAAVSVSACATGMTHEPVEIATDVDPVLSSNDRAAALFAQLNAENSQQEASDDEDDGTCNYR